MTRLELLTIVVGRARSKWLRVPPVVHPAGSICLGSAPKLHSPSSSSSAVIMPFSFPTSSPTPSGKPANDITFSVPAQSYKRPMPDGTVKTITRKPFIRRSSRRDAWRYHLGRWPSQRNPLRYLRKYLNVEDELLAERSIPRRPKPTCSRVLSGSQAPTPFRSRMKPIAHPIPTDLPAFLRRPYRS